MVKDAILASDRNEPQPEADGTLTEYTSEATAPCTVTLIAGHTLHIRTPLQLPLQSSVKVEHNNRMWAGEVWACEPCESVFAIEIQTTLMLDDLAAVENLADRFMHRRGDRTAGDSGYAIPIARRREHSDPDA